MPRAVYSPSPNPWEPDPSANRLNSLGSKSAPMPGPWSLTVTIAHSSSARFSRVSSSMTRPPSGVCLISFVSRLFSTCEIASGSASTHSSSAASTQISLLSVRSISTVSLARATRSTGRQAGANRPRSSRETSRRFLTSLVRRSRERLASSASRMSFSLDSSLARRPMKAMRALSGVR